VYVEGSSKRRKEFSFMQHEAWVYLMEEIP
jgi:hypothetical protein